MSATANLFTTEGEIVNGTVGSVEIYKVAGASSERDALRATGLPSYQQQHARMGKLRVTSIRARLQNSDQDRVNWLVTVTYSVADGRGAGSGGTGRITDAGVPENFVIFRNETTAVPLENAFSDNNATKVPDVPVVNTLQERPDPPLQIPSRNVVIVATCFYANPNIEGLLSLQGTTNNADITVGGITLPKHGAIMRAVTPQPFTMYDSAGKVRTDTSAWSFQYEIVNTPAFKEIWNMSVNTLNLEQVRIPIRDGEGNPVTEPQHIDENSEPSETPLLLKFRYAPEADWLVLDMPSDMPRPADTDELFDDLADFF